MRLGPIAPSALGLVRQLLSGGRVGGFGAGLKEPQVVAPAEHADVHVVLALLDRVSSGLERFEQHVGNF
ncbi:hypothetical protein D3C77_647610 [compost metagenome]